MVFTTVGIASPDNGFDMIHFELYLRLALHAAILVTTFSCFTGAIPMMVFVPLSRTRIATPSSPSRRKITSASVALTWQVFTYFVWTQIQ